MAEVTHKDDPNRVVPGCRTSPATSILPASDVLRLDRRRLLVLGGLGVLTIALLLTLGDGRQALDALRDADWRLLGVAVLIHYSGFAVRGRRWQLLLRSAGHRLGYAYVTALLLAGWFASALLPARAGDVLRIGALRLGDARRPPVPVADGLGTIVMERALDLLAILVLGVFFGFLMLRVNLPGWVLAAYAGAAMLLCALGLMVAVAPRLLTRAGAWSDNTLWRKTLDFVAQVVVSLGTLARRPGVALAAVVASLYIWLCDALLLWLAIVALGGDVAFGAAAFVALTVDIFAAIPLTPGGVGQIETAYAALLALLALPAVNIAAVVLATRLLSYWSFLLFSGVVTYIAGFGAILRRPSTLDEGAKHRG